MNRIFSFRKTFSKTRKNHKKKQINVAEEGGKQLAKSNAPIKNIIVILKTRSAHFETKKYLVRLLIKCLIKY